MRIRRRSWGLVLGLMLASAPLAAQGPVVHAVLFYSPTCPHCHKVITEDLPPLVQQYGDRLMIVGIDVTTPNGGRILQDAANHYGIPLTQVGVPLMVVDDQVLMGDLEIPQRLPGIIKSGLARGGTAWPPLPLLRDALVAQGIMKDSTSVAADSVVASTAGQAAGQAATGQAATAQPNSEKPADNSSAQTATEKPAAPQPATEQPLHRPATQRNTAPAPGQASPAAAGTSAPADTAAAAERLPGATSANQPASASPVSSALASGQPGSRASAQEGISTGLAGTATAANLTMAQRFALDPVANTVALVVLLFMLGVASAALSMVRRRRSRFSAGPAWWIPLLAVFGLGIALYLSFVEVTGAEAVCGPVGDCNTVQQSVYAHVLGMPVGVLGAIGYVVIGLLWALAQKGRGVWRERAAAGLWAATFTGVLFSIYLTFLEPFVIGATCAWCLGSAVVMTLLLAAATGTLNVAMRPAETASAAQPPALV
ncbi:MAG: vitamin K epoxide reductase family protein [Gemmatimonadota bacterium]|jgi:uncharacterized membrane protein/thiol-disulfide isomerase/thioredoxin